MSPMTGRSTRVASSLPGYRCNDYQTVGTPTGKSVRAIESPLLISGYRASRKAGRRSREEPFDGQAATSRIRPSWLDAEFTARPGAHLHARTVAILIAALN